MDRFLRPTRIIDWDHPEVFTRARALADGATDPLVVARRCFEWVRDEIKHSLDHTLTTVTCHASQVLTERSGYCFAKSHLLAALLRANGIPAGLCYQRLSCDEEGTRFSLHGLNAVLLPNFGWYRVDPRGNRAEIDARFAPPIERLAFPLTLAGEWELPEIWADPLPEVVEVLTTYSSVAAVYDRLPDVVSWGPLPGTGA